MSFSRVHQTKKTYFCKLAFLVRRKKNKKSNQLSKSCSKNCFEKVILIFRMFYKISNFKCKSLKIKKRYYNLINTINVKKHLKGIQAEADATCEKSILNGTMHSLKKSQCNRLNVVSMSKIDTIKKRLKFQRPFQCCFTVPFDEIYSKWFAAVRNSNFQFSF